MKTIAEQVAGSVEDAHKHWGWYVALGVALILAGACAIYSQTASTLASVVVLGGIVLVVGVMQTITAFMARGAGHVVLYFLVGILDIVVGAMLMQHPDVGALTLTLLLATLLVFGGLFRFIAALWLQFPQYGWAAVSGIVTFILGLLLWAQWPFSAMWFIGFAVGVNFIFAGITWSTIGWKLKTA